VKCKLYGPPSLLLEKEPFVSLLDRMLSGTHACSISGGEQKSELPGSGQSNPLPH